MSTAAQKQGTDAGKEAYERRREQIRNAQRSHRQRKQTQLTTMRQNVHDLTKEIASLKRELQLSQNENKLLIEQHERLLLQPRSKRDGGVPPSPSSSSLSGQCTPSLEQLAYSSTNTSHSDSDFDVHFEQSYPSSATTRSPAFWAPVVGHDHRGCTLCPPSHTYFTNEFVPPPHRDSADRTSSLQTECPLHADEPWTQFGDQPRFVQHSELFDQEQMEIMPHSWCHELSGSMTRSF